MALLKYRAQFQDLWSPLISISQRFLSKIIFDLVKVLINKINQYMPIFICYVTCDLDLEFRIRNYISTTIL